MAREEGEDGAASEAEGEGGAACGVGGNRGPVADRAQCLRRGAQEGGGEILAEQRLSHQVPGIRGLYAMSPPGCATT